MTSDNDDDDGNDEDVDDDDEDVEDDDDDEDDEEDEVEDDEDGIADGSAYFPATAAARDCWCAARRLAAHGSMGEITS